MTDAAPLVAASHGTRDSAGQAVINELRAAIGAARPGLEVVEAYVDEEVQQPGLTEVVAELGWAVVVPLLLSAGYHVHNDVMTVVAATGEDVVIAAPLGPDSILADVLADRLDQAGLTDHTVVLAAAGSSDQRAATDVERTAGMLSARLGRSVTAAYATASRPRIPEVISVAHDAGERVALASYLLAPGFFHDRLCEQAADVVTAPLLPHPAIVELVLRRYDGALVTAG